MLASRCHLRQLSRSLKCNDVLHTVSFSTSVTQNKNSFICREDFERRHNGTSQSHQEEMLKAINIKVSVTKNRNLIINKTEISIIILYFF